MAEHAAPRSTWRNLIFNLVLALILLVAALFRFTGIDWGEYSFMHPDERFLLMVGSSIEPVGSLSEYFDTANSSLNPHNRGHGFYVYGTLPMFLTRYAVQAVFGQSGLVEMTDAGRTLAALMDLLIVLLVYLVANRLYGRSVALLAAAFSAATVLQIQQAHYFTMDPFITFFTVLAIYFSVQIATGSWPARSNQKYSLEQEQVHQAEVPPLETSGQRLHAFAPQTQQASRFSAQFARVLVHPLFLSSIAFGIALGCAVASKINAAPVALMLPAALAVRLFLLPPEERQSHLVEALWFLALGAVTSLLVFRVFQPYAFSGPGFFDVLPNEAWVANIREQRIQASGDVDFPPALQWARRPIWFSFENILLWGLGLPTGILAWAGFLWASWRIWKGDWYRHILPWGWVAFYFTWQSLQFNPTMRYQYPIYPFLAIFAAWALVALYERGHPSRWNIERKGIRSAWSKILAVIAGLAVLLTTYAYAFAFTQIYISPFTRVEASYWIYQNIPGPLNLRIQTQDGVYNQPLPYAYDHVLQAGMPFAEAFRAQESGLLSEIYLQDLSNPDAVVGEKDLTLILAPLPESPGRPAQGTLRISFPQENQVSARPPLVVPLNQSFELVAGESYSLTLELLPNQGPVRLSGWLDLPIYRLDGSISSQPIQLTNALIGSRQTYTIFFAAQADGDLEEIALHRVQEMEPVSGEQTLNLSFSDASQVLSTGSLILDLSREAGGQASGNLVKLDPPVQVQKGELYNLSLSVDSDGGGITLKGAPIANEGDWDDGLPLRLGNFDGFGGIYPTGLNFNMYWQDNPEKLARFERILDEAEYILITSSRQWGSLPRLPERFPLVTQYYRHLIGCPEERSIEWCYNVAQVGDFQGNLGFELVEVFHTRPTIGPVSINTQFAEEAFTVYDHPKVFVFQKTGDYDSQHVSSILRQVDLTRVIHITPKKAPSHPADLMLPANRLLAQRLSGTWSELFNTQALHNSSQVVGVIVWYLSIGLLGFAVYPLVRLAMPGLVDRGYPLARTAGLLILTYMVWAAGSLNIPSERFTITAVVILIALVGLLLAYVQRDEIRQEWRQGRRYYLLAEGLFLAFFLAGLLIRLGNPDLWHQWKGGERPMDFSYFNAILKSSTFPPYDPWYAGGYLNYYYYGFVLVGVLVKWLGIVPAFAYNLILPTIFALIALGAFSVAWNLSQRGERRFEIGMVKLLPAIAAALGMVVLGNLGSVRMILHGYQRLAAPGGVIDDAGALSRVVWTFEGLGKALSGASLPYSLGDWYWIPSRVIPAAPGDIEPITEFPYFTVLYGDPHAHLYALPVALLALGWAVSVALGVGRWRSLWGGAVGFFLGALAIGALYPINLSDIYTYLPLGMAAIAYALWRHYDPQQADWLGPVPARFRRFLVPAFGVIILLALVLLLYRPYTWWYGQAYGSVDFWKGGRTPTSSYLTHWGLFLFVIVSWMIWETRDWMAKTPLSALRKLDPYRQVIAMAVLLLLVWTAGMLWIGVHIAWLVIPLAAWAGVLLFRPGLNDSKRVVLFLFGTGLLITLMVEVIVVIGDIGRMNTVFKFYLQVWTLFAVGAGTALGWLLAEMPAWTPRWRLAWQFPFILLVFSAAVFTLLGTTAKMRDRMAPDAPHTLDGMAFMQHATFNEQGVDMDLSQDYAAIRWMQENVIGSPVIVEANSGRLYQWFSRFTIYTGLPGVLGWDNHQRQQRALLPPHWVNDRLVEINLFYQTTDIEAAWDFLEKYDVRYIVLGQLERLNYPAEGLQKFPDYEGNLWRLVYQDRDTEIYQVLESQPGVALVK
jgi:YYY domain-containing protein